MVFAALLRGINVGGNNKIEMKRLKETFLRLGMKSVTTYINSGNVIFIADASKEKLVPLLEQGIRNDFGIAIKVLIRSLDEFEAMMQFLPEEWSNDDQKKADVLFLRDDLEEHRIKDLMALRRDVDALILAPGAVFWSAPRQDAAKSGLIKLVGTPMYKEITVRNVNSVRKIGQLMKETQRSTKESCEISGGDKAQTADHTQTAENTR